MKRLILLLSSLAVLLAFLGCQTAKPVAAAPAPASYSVRYNPNGATGGDVPQDSTNYIQGATVTVLGNNAGTLVNPGYAFDGWSTEPNGKGAVYDSRGAFGPPTFTMGSANVALYAVWKDPIVGPWNLTSVNGMAISLAPKGFDTMTFTASEVSNVWTIATAPTSGSVATSTGTWIVATTPTNYALKSANIVILNAVLSGSTLTLTPTTMGETQVLVFSKQ
jgi:hypothetical protein